ncbi:MAG: hypothetical protein HYW47_04320 [Deltaproteobacteria bacterium]|nr:hypothetical protein [Deltaproteobacteria bacterium]
MESRTQKICGFSLFFLIPFLSHSYFTTPTYVFEHGATSRQIIRTLKIDYKIKFSENSQSCLQSLYLSSPDSYRMELQCGDEKKNFGSSSDFSFGLWKILFSSSENAIFSALQEKNILETFSGTLPLPLFKKEKFILKKNPLTNEKNLEKTDLKELEERFEPENIVYIDNIEFKKFTTARAQFLPVKFEDGFAQKIFLPQNDMAYILMDFTNRAEKIYPSPLIFRFFHEEVLYQVRFEDYHLHKGVLRIPKKITVSEIERKEIEEGFEETETSFAQMEFEQVLVNIRISPDFFNIKENSSLSHNEMEKLLDLCYR